MSCGFHRMTFIFDFYYGAGGRTRTGTVSLPVDFESTTSANSITPAHIALMPQKELYNSLEVLSTGSNLANTDFKLPTLYRCCLGSRNGVPDRFKHCSSDIICLIRFLERDPFELPPP